MHILIDGYWNTPYHPHRRITPLCIIFSPDARCRYQPHRIFSLVLPTIHPGLVFTLLPPMFGIHCFMHIYAALMCQPIYFRLKNDIKFDCKARSRDRFAF